MNGRKQDCVSLEEATGFELKIFGKEGEVLCNVGLFAADCGALCRTQMIVLSAARTLAYMYLFCEGDELERGFYASHLHDFERKMRDFQYFVRNER